MSQIYIPFSNLFYFLKQNFNQISNYSHHVYTSIFDQFNQLLSPKIPRKITIFVVTLTGKLVTLDVQTNYTIYQVKRQIFDAEGIPVHHQILTYNERVLENNRILEYYGIQDNVTLLVKKVDIKNVTQYVIDPQSLDPKYNYDFTDVKDSGLKFMRGKFEYRRPIGWKRYAIKVRGKYENDAWLGKDTFRTESCKNEWPVSYHGTAYHNANSIVNDGYLLSKGKNFAYGRGIYSTPDIKVAEKYATEFTFKGETYKLILQNRVNPKSLIPVKTYVGEYWISPKGEDLRAYGICIKKKESFFSKIFRTGKQEPMMLEESIKVSNSSSAN
ncbi:2252_t:CDS:1 [Acaulospora morrowiae]|uniref:2252_t:CDS:1 n=1 Tax=Acaulospora morrowiae TaxID=94023 RepID=A0A9N9AS80_9GLOM|nr:2252_t:CDS:1 [Acaulospora morrowiae]